MYKPNGSTRIDLGMTSRPVYSTYLCGLACFRLPLGLDSRSNLFYVATVKQLPLKMAPEKVENMQVHTDKWSTQDLSV
jgi:hypothetical protein